MPHKHAFYKRYVDDINNRRKKHEEYLLFKKLNNYHPKIKLKIDVSPPKFLDTKNTFLKMKLMHLPIEKKVNYLFLGNLKCLALQTQHYIK